MMDQRLSLLCACLWLVVASTTSGCSNERADAGAKSPPTVTVGRPVRREVVDYAEFTGQTDATESVDIRARVSGYLGKVEFKPGAEVKEGTPLFEIDRRPYQAELDRAQGQVALSKARLTRLNQEYQRNLPLFRNGTISPQEFEKIVGERGEAEGALKAAKADIEGFQLKLDFTKVTAPITGRVGRPLITAGNLVQADATLLTTIVSQGTIYVYFSVDERAYRRYQDLVQAGKLKASADRLVLMQRENEKGFPHRGSIDFIESKLNQGTGTVQARATFPDPQKVIKAGEFVQIRVPVGEPEKALLIPEDAVGFDQGQKYVYVVDDQNKVEYRKVTTGAVHRGLQAVEAGLRAREWIVVKGLQRVRDGETVQPEREATTK